MKSCRDAVQAAGDQFRTVDFRQALRASIFKYHNIQDGYTSSGNAGWAGTSFL
jgi:hypothetical protein